MARIGTKQLQLLAGLGSPTCALIVGDKMSASLIRRGLLQERDPDRFICITPAGLRVLADEMESGRVATAIERMQADIEKRRARKRGGE